MNKTLFLTSLGTNATMAVSPNVTLQSNVVKSQLEKRQFFNLGDSLSDTGAFVNIIQQGAQQVLDKGTGMAVTLGKAVLKKLAQFKYDNNFLNNQGFFSSQGVCALSQGLKALDFEPLKPAWKLHLEAKFKMMFINFDILNSQVDSQKIYEKRGEKDGNNYAVYGAQIIPEKTFKEGDLLAQIILPLSLENQVNNIINRQHNSGDVVGINIGTHDFISKIKKDSINSLSSQWIENLINHYETSIDKLLNANYQNIMGLGLGNLSLMPLFKDKSVSEKQMLKTRVLEFNQKLSNIFSKKQQTFSQANVKMLNMFDKYAEWKDYLVSQRGSEYALNATTNDLPNIFTNFGHLLSAKEIVLKAHLNAKTQTDPTQIKNYLFFDQIHPGVYANQQSALIMQKFIQTNF